MLLPLDNGAVALPGAANVLLLRARFGAALCHRPLQRWNFAQSFKPWASELERAGLLVADPPADARYQLVALLPPRQREESRALLARAVRHAADGGVVLAAAANNAGARSCAADLERLAGPLQSLSKHKCRAFWTAPLRDQVDQSLCAQWLALDAPRPIAEGFTSRPGLFAWDRIDPASALLAAQLPGSLSGAVADLGGGYGYLSAHVLRHCPQVTRVDLYEAEARALEPARQNLQRAVDARAAAAGSFAGAHAADAIGAGAFDAVAIDAGAIDAGAIDADADADAVGQDALGTNALARHAFAAHAANARAMARVPDAIVATAGAPGALLPPTSSQTAGAPKPPFSLHWHDVVTGLPRRYRHIVSNPPFHVGRADRPQLGQAFIHAAADALDPDGSLWLVANRHLPYEQVLASRFGNVRLVADAVGFKVFEAREPRA